MPLPPNILNCLILESKSSMRFVPSHFQVYFINSKRRFFLYFRKYRDMMQTMKCFSDNKVVFYRRESILPDREEHEQQVFHCNYKHKRIDIRKRLSKEATYNEPKVLFDKYNAVKQKFAVNQQANDQQIQQLEVKQSKRNDSNQEEKVFEEPLLENMAVPLYANKEVQSILENKDILMAILLGYRDEE